MSDEVTLGEVRRGLLEHRQSSAEQHRALDERITSLANHSVTDAVYQLDKAATVEMARRLERDRVEGERKMREDVIKPALDRIAVLEAKDAARPGMTFGKWMQVLGVIAAFAAVLVTAWVATKGAK